MSLGDFIIKPTFDNFISSIGIKKGFAPNLYYALLFYNPKIGIEINDIVQLQNNYTKEFANLFYAIYLCFCLSKKIPAADISTNLTQITQFSKNQVTTKLFNEDIVHYDDLVLFRPFTGENFKVRFSAGLISDKEFIKDTLQNYLNEGFAVTTLLNFKSQEKAIWKFPLNFQNN